MTSRMIAMSMVFEFSMRTRALLATLLFGLGTSVSAFATPTAGQQPNSIETGEARFDEIRKSGRMGLPELAELQDVEYQISDGYLRQRREKDPAYLVPAEERRKFREEVLMHNLTALEQQFARAKSTIDIDAILDKYLYRGDGIFRGDMNTAAGQAVLTVAQKSSQAMRPFRALGGGYYLDAIYNNDLSTVREYDRSFAYRMVGGGGATSLLFSVLTTYMKHYQETSSRCLRSGYQIHHLEVIHQGSTVYYKFVPLVTDPGSRELLSYKLNVEFTPAWEKLATTNPSRDALAAELNGDRGVSKLLEGTEAMMSGFACDSPQIQRMEKNMRLMFTQISADPIGAGRVGSEPLHHHWEIDDLLAKGVVASQPIQAAPAADQQPSERRERRRAPTP